MSIFPVFNDAIKEKVIPETSGTKEPLFDFKTKQIVIKDGKVVMATKIEQVMQWIELLIRTEVDKYAVYKDTNFGMTNLYALRGHSLFETPFFIMELEREIKEKIEAKSDISSVTDIKTEYNFNKLIISITVELVSGETLTREVNI
ncbi:DUF2634 domain-containing protein [Cetobacterium somerae]|uniref:DUF2634 domain-containing protein n=1 Tax=Cetobacterium somerae TaxID=188913 RepID=UPI00211E1563|nr:DUF2634 domain-containing protein [Cetobacterium somerae]MCQ9627783.1 DUF2634 domain-containing protein [Cetobacterium somerae]